MLPLQRQNEYFAAGGIIFVSPTRRKQSHVAPPCVASKANEQVLVAPHWCCAQIQRVNAGSIHRLSCMQVTSSSNTVDALIVPKFNFKLLHNSIIRQKLKLHEV